MSSALIWKRRRGRISYVDSKTVENQSPVDDAAIREENGRPCYDSLTASGLALEHMTVV